MPTRRSRVQIPFPAQNLDLIADSIVLKKISGGVAKWLRRWSAKPLFSGSNPLAASNSAEVAELVDAQDLKSCVPLGRAGSSPALGTLNIWFSRAISSGG